MLSKIPSWGVAVTGAAIAIIATATSSTLLYDVVRGTESRIKSLRSRESWIYLAYVFFNLLGLMVAMCKDLPVWRSERAAAGAG